tara:strand:- start:8283 stop:9800 length:1518 start_codon:yes stop_codon:yes gene_type:complete
MQQVSENTRQVIESHHKVAIIGTGFAGLCMAIRLKQQGEEDFVLYEKSETLGGTWRDNTYPGCGCDVPSHLYSLSFEHNPNWLSKFASQGEILQYLHQLTKKYQVEQKIKFSTEITDMVWDTSMNRWLLTAATGKRFTATVVISAMGGLHVPSTPNTCGRENFLGHSFHSSQWRHDVELRNKRVAVIGTGASAIQFIPEIAPRVAELTIFQRTPPWILPRNNRSTSPFERLVMQRLPWCQQACRLRHYLSAEVVALGLTVKPKLMGKGQKQSLDFLHNQVHDKTLRHKLTPQYTMGCKRILLSDDFYATLNQANVTLVTDTIKEITRNGIQDATNNHWPTDVIIFATGFKPFNPTHSMHIQGREGRVLKEEWGDTPLAFKGVCVAGYPNFFMLMGPNTGLGHNSVLLMIETQVKYILQCLQWLEPRHGRPQMEAIEVREDVQKIYNERLQKQFDKSVWRSDESVYQLPCKSWYKTKDDTVYALWPSFVSSYRWMMRRADIRQFYR